VATSFLNPKALGREGEAEPPDEQERSNDAFEGFGGRL